MVETLVGGLDVQHYGVNLDLTFDLAVVTFPFKILEYIFETVRCVKLIPW